MSNGTYWKRRVFLLIGLLAVVALVAYACQPSAPDNATHSANTESSPEAEPSAAESPEPSISASPSPSDEPSAEPSGDADDSSGGEGGDGGDGDAESAGAGGGANGGDGGEDEPQRSEDSCRTEDVVVTVTADRSDYASGVEPEFALSVVNTGAQTCTVDVGRTAMELRVTSGDDRIWSTADCVEGGAAQKEQLRRGVPHTSTITWDRARSWTDCRDQNVNARSGTYVATLHSDYDEGAEAQVFRLN